MRVLALATCLVLTVVAASSPRLAFAATITVSTTADDSTVNGNCTLREAIAAANGNTAVDGCTAGSASPTVDLIGFSLGGGTPTIAISSALGALPVITETVTIDGSTGGATRVELNGGNFGAGVDGLRISSANVTVRKLVINRFTGDGIEINGGGATGNRVEGSLIGTNAAGTSDLGNGKDGVLITGGANQNIIGGDVAGQRNVIAGNESHGVEISGTTSAQNTVKVNYIGVDSTGLARLWNEGHGVSINDSPQNTVGCTTVVPCVVAGGRPNMPPFPDLSLVRIVGGNAISNTVVGSYLGVGADGSTSVGSLSLASNRAAVSVIGSSPGFGSGTVIGCATVMPCNVIAANNPAQVGFVNVVNAMVIGNYIGTNAAGSASLMPAGLSPEGIKFDGCINCQIGGTGAGQRNLVSGNSTQILINGAISVVVEGNIVGPNLAATAPMSSNYGIFVSGSSSVRVGGPTAASRNIISGLGGLTPGVGDGVTVTDCSSCLVQGNYIGTNLLGTAAVPNIRGIGVTVDAPKNVTISSNLVSGNTREGLELEDSGYVTVTGNIVGLGADGSTAIPNGDGIVLTFGMDHAQIGGTTTADRNVIAANLGNGIVFDGIDTAVELNRIQGNYIGLAVDGVTARGNQRDGIVFVTAAPDNTPVQDNLIGGDVAGAGNVIAGNVSSGVHFMGAGTVNNVVAGNIIGLAANGTTAVPNLRQGVDLGGASFCVNPMSCPDPYVTDAPGMQRIGTNGDGMNDAAERNVISANGQNGIFGAEVCTTNGCAKAGDLSRISGNLIGLAMDGLTARGNGGDGIRWHANGATIGSDVNGTSDDLEANRIGNNGGDGVRVENGGTANAIRRNEIYANGCITCTDRLAIDLQAGTAGVGDGMTPNDLDDVDAGTNDFQNFPTLSTAQFQVSSGIVSSVVITFSADVRATECTVGLPCRVEFYFTGDTPDPSGNGEGRSFLGTTAITGDVSGRVFTLTLTTPATACGGRYCHGGDRISAALTNNLGSTSEFAANVTAGQTGIVPGDCNADFLVNAGDNTAIVLEIFDGDGSSPGSVTGGTFPGHPIGCNPNGDAAVDAGDLSCLAKKLFNGLAAGCP